MEKQCNGTRLKLCDDDTCQKCFQKSFASHEKSKYWSDKNDKNPRDVFKSTNKKFIFYCEICAHTFSTTLSHIVSGRWCPYCANPPQKLCDSDTCAKCFQMSFASHEKANCWSVKNEKKSREVLKSSNKKYIFLCDICGHEFEAVLGNIWQNTWCHYCSNTYLCDNDNCKICFSKSFASCEKVKYWSNKNTKKPRDVFKISAYKYIFFCGACDHEFYISLSAINSGNWCPFCVSKKICSDELCKQCFNKSFSSHEKSKYWSHKNIFKPRNIFKGCSTNKFYFNCDVCEMEFCSTPAAISNGKWCPFCKNKTEKKLLKWLIDEFNNYDIQYQKSYDWCIYPETKKYAKYDFFIAESNIIIELDGDQHFRQVSNWDDPKITKERDIFKIEKAIENKCTIIHILQEDVFNDKNDWKFKLKYCISRQYNETICVFINNNNKYSEHINNIKNKNIKIEIL